MSLSVGIVGLPNVGKSTLFNALLKRQAALAANYPFATIEPNVGIVPVPDRRLDALAEVVKQESGINPPIKPATIEFMDIAGLVAGASKGEGLGNKFLAHIRETNLIVHVLRAFEDENVIREGAKDPASDLKTIRLELMLADLETLNKQKPPKGTKDKNELARWQVILEFQKALETEAMPVSLIAKEKDQHKKALLVQVAKELGLITAKKELFVINMAETDLSNVVDGLTKDYAQDLGVDINTVLVMSNQIESELSSLDEADQELYLKELGLKTSGLNRLIQAAYQRLGLQSFLTAGEKEVKAWTIKRGTTAQQAAGVIHSDFAKKFIKANIVNWQEFVNLSGWKRAREAGKIHQEGRDYLMQDGDVVEFAIGS